MSNKEFKNLTEQIAILRSKGLVINDEDKTKEILFRENYFFINGYRHLFMRSERDRLFIPETTFEELYGLFQFDRSFRNIMFKNLLIIENNLKSIISYQLSRKYGFREKEYLRPENFVQDRARIRQVNDVINKMKRQIRVNGKQHSATSHYLSNYGYIPMWVLVKVLSFGMINELYGILKPEDQAGIANNYKIDPEVLATFIALLSNYRNLCAHEDILFENRTQRHIIDTKYHLNLNISKMDEEYVYGKDDLYALVIIFKFMLRDEEFRTLIYEIGYELNILEGRLKAIPITKVYERMGFPKNWKEIINID